MSDAQTRQVAIFDLTTVVGLSSAYVVMDLTSTPKRWLITAMVLALASYGWVVLRRGRKSWRDFCLRADNLREAIRPVGLGTFLAVVLILRWAYACFFLASSSL